MTGSAVGGSPPWGGTTGKFLDSIPCCRQETSIPPRSDDAHGVALPPLARGAFRHHLMPGPTLRAAGPVKGGDQGEKRWRAPALSVRAGATILPPQ